MQKRRILTTKQLINSINYVEELIGNLPDKALKEILSGYGNDISLLFDNLIQETYGVISGSSQEIESENLGYLSNLEKALDEQLKKVSYNYFKTTVLTNFNQNWRNLEWGNMAQLYPYSAYLCQRGSGKSYEFCYAFPLWRLYTYDRQRGFLADTIDNKNRKETMIITNESSLGKNHVSKIVEEIKFNPILDEKLNPTGKANLGKEGVETETGSILKLRTYGSSGIRGNHLGACIVDDFFDKSALYSKEQRDKFKEVFYAEITNIVEPGGHLLVSGTPFHELDLYGDLKKDPKFTVFEYPGIFPNGTILAPDRFSFDYLMELRQSLGSIVFSREILVSPVSDKSSLFPYEFLSKSSIGMETIDFVDNIESYPFKMKRVVVGADFSISGGIGSDFVVYTVWGVDAMDNYHLLHIWRTKGVSHNEMVSQLVSLDQRFKPNAIVPESNNFQRILANLAKERGLKNIKEFVTGTNKKDLYSGLPSLSAMFERGQIKIPSKTGSTMDMTQLIFSEFNSVTFNEDSGKLESVSGHDDIPMSCWLAINELRENKNVFKGYYV